MKILSMGMLCSKEGVKNIRVKNFHVEGKRETEFLIGSSSKWKYKGLFLLR